ncbi:hypothetical protein AVEN_38949-1 [Araneus ventricosus]|uniref:Uncharacterized protein n=1 Tax=Araneus ventricosus TaxID=182803 RepID=A0A4Y2S261_ARAVE|nr:hypothetical protein AVEN_38949-1 [Araneus ventricosus]
MGHRTEQVPQREVLIKTPPKGAGFESGALGLFFSGRDEKGATPSCDEKSASDPPAIPRNLCRTCLHPKSLRQLARGTLFGPTCNPAAETASPRPAPIGAREHHLRQHPVKFSEVLKLGVNQQSSETGGSGGQLPNELIRVLQREEVNTIPR